MRKARGLSMEVFGAEAGKHMADGKEIAVATVAKLEKSQMGLTLDYMQAFAAALGVSVFEIVAPAGQAIKTIPLVGRIAAGKWLEALQDVETYIPIPNNVGGTRAFALRPFGDSMNQIVREDGFIVVDPDELDLIDGKIFAVCNGDGETTFKRYRADPPTLWPCSDNPEHQPMPLGREPFVVMGRVVYAGTLL